MIILFLFLFHRNNGHLKLNSNSILEGPACVLRTIALSKRLKMQKTLSKPTTRFPLNTKQPFYNKYDDETNEETQSNTNAIESILSCIGTKAKHDLDTSSYNVTALPLTNQSSSYRHLDQMLISSNNVTLSYKQREPTVSKKAQKYFSTSINGIKLINDSSSDISVSATPPTATSRAADKVSTNKNGNSNNASEFLNFQASLFDFKLTDSINSSESTLYDSSTYLTLSELGLPKHKPLATNPNSIMKMRRILDLDNAHTPPIVKKM